MSQIDAGIAQVINDAGIGDFSAPASAVPPAIIIGMELEEPKQTITVLPASGLPPDRIIGRFPKITVITRDPGYEVARDRAQRIHELLDQHQGALDGLPCGRIQSDSLPVYLGRDPSGREGGLAKFTQTFTVFTHDL